MQFLASEHLQYKTEAMESVVVKSSIYPKTSTEKRVYLSELIQKPHRY